MKKEKPLYGNTYIFDEEFLNTGVLVLYDISNETVNISLTNSVELIIKEVGEDLSTHYHTKLTDLIGIIYRDSTGYFDIIEIDEAGEFSGFGPLQERDEEEAVKKIKALK